MTSTAPPTVARDTEQPERSRWQRVRAPSLVIGGLAAATLALHLRDPHESGSWGFCPSAALGIYCPGCGGLRAVNDLTNGDVGAAASSNLILVALLPIAIVLLALWAADRWVGRRRSFNQRWLNAAWLALGGCTVAFTVLRNLPSGSWLAP